MYDKYYKLAISVNLMYLKIYHTSSKRRLEILF